jgi:hypothetical protein
VQILSQLSEPRPDVRVTTVFASGFPGNGISELMSFKPGNTYRIVLGIENMGSETI